MKSYFKSLVVLIVSMCPFQGMGQPSWINEDLVLNIPFNESVEEVAEGATIENFGVTLEQDRFGVENSSGKFVKLDRTGLLISRDDIDYTGQDWTFSMWLKESPREAGGLNQVLGIYQTDLSQPFQTDDLIWFFSLLYDWSVRPLIRLTGNWGERGFSGYDLVTGHQQSLNWNHIVLTITNERIYRLYVNGKIKNWDTFPPLNEDMILPEGDLYIGQSYDGLIDDFKFYRKSLTRQEVAELYQYESDGLQDTDGDGVIDFTEGQLGTDPNDPDTDDDGLLDGEELELGTSPLLVDSDNDGYDDLIEVDNQTDPTSDKSSPEILEIFTSVELNFGTSEGFTYQLQYSSDLIKWINYEDPFDGTGGKTIIHVSIKNTGMNYFRLLRLDAGTDRTGSGPF